MAGAESTEWNPVDANPNQYRVTKGNISFGVTDMTVWPNPAAELNKASFDATVALVHGLAAEAKKKKDDKAALQKGRIRRQVRAARSRRGGFC